MSERESTITFCVSGHVTQQIKWLVEGITEEELEAGLKSGKYATTLQEDGHVIDVNTNENIAIVVNVDNECGYDDYEVE